MSDWTIYTLGDLPMFNQVLNAVAMVFKPGTGIFAGTGVFGFGGAIVVGLMFALIMVLANTMIAQASGGGSKFNLASLLMIAIILYAFLIPSRVVLEDIHTGRNSVVANIPIGISVPASLISTLTRRVSEKFETAFSTVDGNYITMGQQGFVNPIQLLASLRGAVLAADQQFVQSFLFAYRDCAIWHVNEQALKKEPDPFSYVISKMNTGNGLTMYFSNAYPNGTPVSCARAAIELSKDLNTTLTDNATGAAITNLARQGSVGLPMGAPASGSPVAAFTLQGGGDGTSDTRNGSGLARLFGRSPVLADMNTAAALIQPTIAATPGNPNPDSFFQTSAGRALYTAPLLKVAQKCANTGVDAKTYEDCASVMVNDATRMYTAQLAGESSVFTKMVIPSMNMLMAMFFAFAPIVVLVVAVSGPSGIGILAKYLLFGVWTQSWLPMASIINYLIQISVANDVSSILNGTNVITVANSTGIYDALDRKLTVAFSMLSSVPFISMAVLSGSFYSMTKVADKMTGGGQGGSMDTKMAERASFANAPEHSNLANSSFSIGHGAGRAGAQESAPVISTGQMAQSQRSDAFQQQRAFGTSELAQRSRGITSGWKQEDGINAYNSWKNADTNTHGNGYSQQMGKTVEYLKSKGFSEDEAKDITARYMADKTLGVSGGVGFNAGVSASIDMSEKLNASRAASLRRSMGTKEQQSAALKEVDSITNSSMADFRHSLGKERGRQATASFASGLSGSDGETFTAAMTAASTLSRTATSTDSDANTFGASASIPANVLARDVMHSPGAQSQLQQSIARNGLGEQAEMLFTQYQTKWDTQTARNMANIVALNNNQQTGTARANLLDIVKSSTGLSGHATPGNVEGADRQKVTDGLSTGEGLQAAGNALKENPVAAPGVAKETERKIRAGNTPKDPKTVAGTPPTRKDAGGGRGGDYIPGNFTGSNAVPIPHKGDDKRNIARVDDAINKAGTLKTDFKKSEEKQMELEATKKSGLTPMANPSGELYGSDLSNKFLKNVPSKK